VLRKELIRLKDFIKSLINDYSMPEPLLDAVAELELDSEVYTMLEECNETEGMEESCN
jgi:hypothetical protein